MVSFGRVKPVILEIRNLSKTFGGLDALGDLDLTIQEGTIKSLIGPNGAGKTTLFNVISGIYPPSRGRIFWDGEDITGQKPFQISKKGIARTFQNIRLFNQMTVLENVMVGQHNQTRAGLFGSIMRSSSMRHEEETVRQKAFTLLEFVGLSDCHDLLAMNLPYGKQRLLELARALASGCQLLLLDEPTAGMNPAEMMDLSRTVRTIRDQGITVFLVEHRMKIVMDVSEEIVVLDHGVKIAEGTPEEIRNNEKVIEAYLGEKLR